jgi:hypothetical protein
MQGQDSYASNPVGGKATWNSKDDHYDSNGNNLDLYQGASGMWGRSWWDPHAGMPVQPGFQRDDLYNPVWDQPGSSGEANFDPNGQNTWRDKAASYGWWLPWARVPPMSNPPPVNDPGKEVTLPPSWTPTGPSTPAPPIGPAPTPIGPSFPPFSRGGGNAGFGKMIRYKKNFSFKKRKVNRRKKKGKRY